MSMLSDLLSKSQQLEAELGKLAMGELNQVKAIAQELRQNLEVAVQREVGATEQPPQPAPANPGAGVQTSSDLRNPN